MRRIALVGVNALGESVKYGNEVVKFTDAKNYFSVTVNIDDNGIYAACQVVTPKDTYILLKHSTQNSYHGVCNGRRVHVSLKKIVGEIRYW